MKRIPSNVAQLFTDPLSLAVWYLDDGTKGQDAESCRIATQSFSKDEHILLRDCIQQDFHFSVKIEDWGKKRMVKSVIHLPF